MSGEVKWRGEREMLIERASERLCVCVLVLRFHETRESLEICQKKTKELEQPIELHLSIYTYIQIERISLKLNRSAWIFCSTQTHRLTNCESAWPAADLPDSTWLTNWMDRERESKRKRPTDST